MKKHFIFLVLLATSFIFSFAHSQLTPQQQLQKDQIIDMAMKGLQDPYAGFELIAQQARSNLQSKTLPSIAERFGGLGATRSSGYQSTLSAASQQLERDLEAMRLQYGIQSQIQYQQLLALGLSIQ